jgi:hypothetical protein
MLVKKWLLKMKNIKKYEQFNESNSNELDWNSIESEWNDWYENSNGEADYDEDIVPWNHL